MFPYTRLRRTRKHSWLRDALAEAALAPENLILPMFIIDGSGVREEIKSMPGVVRFSIDEAIKEIEIACRLGIRLFALFPSIDAGLKNPEASEAFNEEGLLCNALKYIKSRFPDIGIICDIALDPYTSHGHDGIVKNNYVDNDETLKALVAQSLVLAGAGADILAPSDMMDGRIKSIREVLESNKFTDISIISYAVKYASNLYGPFRDAVKSTTNLAGASKKTYQMDYRNSKESEFEARLDIEEGADIIMVKPASFYMDIIKDLSIKFSVPVFAYQVSGEYSMIKFASINGALDYESVVMESLISLRRAGARAIFTYAAVDAARILNK
ncbi:MAG: porphobilinogen synthase [Rickettsiaceae bacterium]|nr:porphobilinogen synthase [Rickettsiaceae bacterium]